MSYLFNTFLYEPLYNGLFFFTSIIPGVDLGIAVILLTLLVKFILLPFAHKGTKTQAALRTLQPEIEDIKKKHTKDKQEQARKTMELYKKRGVNPFSGCLTILIQLPIIFALYWVFLRGLSFDPDIVATLSSKPGFINTELLNKEILYSFVSPPAFVSTTFLWFIDVLGKSVFIAALAGISQYLHMKITMPSDEKFSFKNLKSTGSIKDDLAQSMKFQMRYVLPIFVFVFAYTISTAVAIYWATSNIFNVIHELLVRRKTATLQKTKENDNTKM